MGMAFHESRYKKASKYLAYFQNYSNTYAPLEKLKQVYDQALRFPEVTGLVIGTRPDVIDDEKLEYFARLSEKMYVVIEYGIESVNNETLKRVNRQHTYEDAVKAIEKTASYGIRAGGHLMFGFPGETPDMMLRQVEKINQLPLHSIKFHQLQIMKDTVMARQYRQHPERFDFFRLDTYVDFIIDFVEKLHPDFIIERFSGEASPQLVISPQWGKRTHEVLTLIENRMKQRDTWQGKFYAKPTQSVHVA
jgi:hypothetical protein